MTGIVRTILRKNTEGAHLRLHKHPIMAPLSAPSLCINQYINALYAFYGLHISSDERLAELWPQRTRRSRFIATDIKLLGGRPPSKIFISNMPACHSRAQFLGVRYVIDGSSFGAQSLAVNVDRTLGISAKSGASFLNGQGIDSASEWRQLLAWLEDLTAAEERDQATNAAAATFLGIEKWLWQYNKNIVIDNDLTYLHKLPDRGK